MPDLPTKQFSPDQVLLTIGSLPITGYFDGTYITATYPNNLYDRKEGADGEVVFIKNVTGLLVELEFILLQTTQINTALSALVLSAYDSGIFPPIMMKDLEGETILTSPKCPPQKNPNVTYEKGTATGRIWTFTMPKADGIIGGN
jgi:hypothetical protein